MPFKFKCLNCTTTFQLMIFVTTDNPNFKFLYWVTQLRACPSRKSNTINAQFWICCTFLVFFILNKKDCTTDCYLKSGHVTLHIHVTWFRVSFHWEIETKPFLFCSCQLTMLTVIRRGGNVTLNSTSAFLFFLFFVIQHADVGLYGTIDWKLTNILMIMCFLRYK